MSGVRQDRREGTEHGGQCIGPHTRDALTLRLVTLLPAALQADEQPDGKGDGKAKEEGSVVHRLPSAAAPDGSQRVPGLASPTPSTAKLGATTRAAEMP